MDIRKCKQCGRMYSYIRSPYCPECQEKIEEQYLAVRDFLDEEPTASISRIAAETEVPERVILYLIRDERLTLRREDSHVTCGRCHQPIESGKYCADCLMEMEKDLARLSGKASSATTSSETAGTRGKESGAQASERNGMHIQPKRRGY